MEALTAPWISEFSSQLTEAGFDSYREGRDRLFLGSLTVPWLDPSTKTWQRTRHEIEIRVGPGFPFQKPAVRPIGDEAVRGSRHQEPGDDGYLCLWRDNDWDPGTSADTLLARTAEWFRHYHRGDWPPEDSAPDLHLYFPPAGTQRLMITGRDWAPGGDIGWFYVWDAGGNRFFAGRPGSVGDRARQLDDLAARFFGVDPSRPRGHLGLWVRLSREPRPFRALGQMLHEIDAARAVAPDTTHRDLRRVMWETKRRDTASATIALGYPSPTGQQHWLFVTSAVRAPTKTSWSSSNALDRWTVEAYETAPADPNALMRRVGHVARALEDKHAVIFGVGALGGHLALLLAEDGIQRVTLVDGDRLRPGNAVRHVAGLEHVGDWKLRAVRDVILRHAPYCAVSLAAPSWDPKELRALIEGAGVVVDATANRAFGRLLNSVCVWEQIPLITVASHRRGAIGRVRIVRAGTDACLECYDGPGGYSETGANGFVLIPPADEGAFLEEGCATPTVETSSTDLVGIAAVGARAARDVLAGHSPLGGHNQILIVQEPIAGAADPLIHPGSHYQSFRPIVGCQVCGAMYA